MIALSDSEDADRQGASRSPLVSFSLRTLLLLMALAAVASYFIAPYYVVHRSRFEILETQLELEDGFVNGAVSFRCSRLNELDNIEYVDVIVYVENISNTRMMHLKPGDEFFIRNLNRDFGPLKAQNRFHLFMIRELGIQSDEIDYFIEYSGWGELHVKGKVPDSLDSRTSDRLSK